jgi:hypothetical protein
MVHVVLARYIDILDLTVIMGGLLVTKLTGWR